MVRGKGAIKIFPELIEVEAYAGYKGSERPRVFVWQGRRFEIRAVQATWQEEDPGGSRKVFFRVEADDSGSYLLSYAAEEDRWSIEGPPRELG